MQRERLRTLSGDQTPEVASVAGGKPPMLGSQPSVYGHSHSPFNHSESYYSKRNTSTIPSKSNTLTMSLCVCAFVVCFAELMALVALATGSWSVAVVNPAPGLDFGEVTTKVGLWHIEITNKFTSITQKMPGAVCTSAGGAPSGLSPSPAPPTPSGPCYKPAHPTPPPTPFSPHLPKPTYTCAQWTACTSQKNCDAGYLFCPHIVFVMHDRCMTNAHICI
jgi:hypothetical protein